MTAHGLYNLNLCIQMFPFIICAVTVVVPLTFQLPCGNPVIMRNAIV